MFFIPKKKVSKSEYYIGLKTVPQRTLHSYVSKGRGLLWKGITVYFIFAAWGVHRLSFNSFQAGLYRICECPKWSTSYYSFVSILRPDLISTPCKFVIFYVVLIAWFFLKKEVLRFECLQHDLSNLCSLSYLTVTQTENIKHVPASPFSKPRTVLLRVS